MRIRIKYETSAAFFFLIIAVLCFAVLGTASSIDLNKVIVVYHFNLNVYVFFAIFAVFAAFSVFSKPLTDKVTIALFYGAILSLIPLLYATNTTSYIGNYFSLWISLVSYYCCMKTKNDVSESIYRTIIIGCCVLSIQMIQTELKLFSGLSIGNLNNVFIKASINLPIGSSNLIAAILLPLLVFIITYKRNFVSILVCALTFYAILLCRSKNALSLAIILSLVYLVFKVYRFIFIDSSVSRKAKLGVFLFVTSAFGALLLGALKLIGFIVTDLQFNYYSNYSNPVLHYIDTATSGRVVVFQREWERATNHIFFGNGFGYNLGQAKSHNWIIDLLVQRGTVGLILYGYCLKKVFRVGREHYKTDVFIRACTNLLIVVFVQGLFEITVFSAGVDFLIWSMAGFIIARARQLNST